MAKYRKATENDIDKEVEFRSALFEKWEKGTLGKICDYALYPFVSKFYSAHSYPFPTKNSNYKYCRIKIQDKTNMCLIHRLLGR